MCNLVFLRVSIIGVTKYSRGRGMMTHNDKRMLPLNDFTWDNATVDRLTEFMIKIMKNFIHQILWNASTALASHTLDEVVSKICELGREWFCFFSKSIHCKTFVDFLWTPVLTMETYCSECIEHLSTRTSATGMAMDFRIQKCVARAASAAGRDVRKRMCPRRVE